MNLKRRITLAALAALLVTSPPAFAIEGLQISVQCSNVVLAWPCRDDGSETFIVQHRQTLDMTSSWQTLTAAHSADWGTNRAYFVHANVITNANCGGGMYSALSGSSMLRSSGSASRLVEVTEPLAAHADGSGSVVPLKLYPPGFDLSDFLIFDPLTSLWSKGTATASALVTRSSESGTLDGPPEPGEGGGAGGTNAPPETGFYRVVRVGAHLFGLTNGMILSGTVPLPVEFGNPDTNQALAAVFLTEDGSDATVSGARFSDLEDDAWAGIVGEWNTTLTTNGQYTLQLGCRLSDDTVYWDTPVTITVSNAIWFPDPCSAGGQAIYVGAQTVFTNGTWRLDVFDDQDQWVGWLEGPIDGDGYCAYPGIAGPGFSLANTDGQGNQNPSTAYTLVVQAAAVGGGASATVTNKVFIEPPWMIYTRALVCHMQLFQPWQQGWTDVRALANLAWSTLEQFHQNLLGGIESPYQIDSPGAWGPVTNNLASFACRDFVYLGHGKETFLGTGGTILRLSTVRNLLQNNTADPLQGTNRHPFRFVFLDGCNTADGDWPQAFGIPKQAHMTAADFIAKRGIRARAFMGWNRNKKFTTLLTRAYLDVPFQTYRQTFWQRWAEFSGGIPVRGLEDAVLQAANAAPSASGGMVIYGAANLYIDW